MGENDRPALPGPTDWRRVIQEIKEDPIQFRLNLQKTFGNFVYYRHGPAHVYFVNDPELIREVLVDQDDKMGRPQITHKSLARFMGNGLLVSSGESHRRQRRVIQPMLTPTRTATYAQAMVECVDEMLSVWQDGEIRNIAQDMTNLTANIVYRSIFGVQPSNLQNQVFSAITTLQYYSSQIMRGNLQISEAECETAIQQLDDAIADLIAQYRSGNTTSSLLSLLIETPLPTTGQPMSEQEVRDEAVTLLVAGQDTSANALGWTLYLLAQHPDIVDELRTEIDSVLGSNPPGSDDLASLPTTTQIVKESLRLYPPAWLIGRTPSEGVTIGGYPIPAKSTIVICPFVLHRNPDVFPEPEHFLPRRFATEPPKYTYLPFGAGSHVCVGQPFAMQEIMLVLARAMQSWHFELAGQAPVELEPLVTLRPKNGIKMVVRKRPALA